MIGVRIMQIAGCILGALSWAAPVRAADCLLVGMVSPPAIAFVDPVAGNVVATIPINGEPTRIVVEPTRQLAYVTSRYCPDRVCGPGGFYVIDLATREVRFKEENSPGLDLAVDVASSRIFVATPPNPLTLTGYVVLVRRMDTFAVETGWFDFSQLKIESITVEPSTGALIVGDRRSHASTRVYAVRASDGEEIWQTTLGGELSVARADRGGRVLVGTLFSLYLLSSNTGSPSERLGPAIDVDFSAEGGATYVLDTSLRLLAFRLDPTELVGVHRSNTTVEHIASSLSSEIVFGSSRDAHQIVVYDLLAMDSSRRLELPGAPAALAVAETSAGCALEPTHSPTAEPSASPTPTTSPTPALTATAPATEAASDGCTLGSSDDVDRGCLLGLFAAGIVWARRRFRVQEG